MITLASPIGPLHLTASGDELTALYLPNEDVPDVPRAPEGSGFQKIVWLALGAIPFGVTRSYGEIAAKIGRPAASRAVGAANGKNPIAIIVPCHRVIGSNGTLTGYGGGLPTKRWLLEHEGAATLPLCQPGV